METKVKWTEADMISATLEDWGRDDYDPKDCRVIPSTAHTDDDGNPACLVVLHVPTGRTSAEAGDAGRWNLDGTAFRSWELAVQDAHGGWEHAGDFATRELAIEAAKQFHEGGHVHTADDGGSTWGLSPDPLSGQYEECFGIWTEDGESVVVDPLR